MCEHHYNLLDVRKLRHKVPDLLRLHTISDQVRVLGAEHCATPHASLIMKTGK